MKRTPQKLSPLQPFLYDPPVWQTDGRTDGYNGHITARYHAVISHTLYNVVHTSLINLQKHAIADNRLTKYEITHQLHCGPYKTCIGTHRHIDTLAHTEVLGGGDRILDFNL